MGRAVAWRGAVVAAAWVVAMLLVFAPPAHAAATASTTVADTEIAPGGSTEVTLSITGETVTESTPTDIMLVLDESGSITNSQFAQMKNFAASLVTSLGDRGLFDNGGRMGLGMFASTGRLPLALTGSQTTVLNAIHGVQQMRGATCIGCGLQIATQQLTVNTDPNRNRITVLLTDGVNNQPSSYPGGPAQHLQDQITASEAAGIERFAIGVGNYNASELNQIASEPKADHVFTVNDFNDLAGIVGSIVESLDKPAATNVEITPTVAGAFTPGTATASKGTVTQVGNVLTWKMDSLGAETATVTYTVAHDAGQPCALGVAVHDSISYTDDQGATVSFPLGSVDVKGCPPVFAGVPDDVTVEATGPGGAAVAYTPPTATDAIDGSSVPVVCDHPSGATFPLGPTTVTCTATDDDGNTAEATFVVTVIDTTGPVITGVPDNVTVAATGPDGAVVAYTPPTADDLVDGAVAVTCAPPSGTTFALGATTVTCTATDAAGNSSEASFTVTVLSIDQMLQSLLEYVTGKGAGNSLRSTVLAAQRAEDRGDLATACNQLQALINEASAQTPNHLTVEQRDWIIAAATDIRQALGC